MSERAKTTRAGFTLVELLVVIGIIALLVGILAPFISKAMQQGEMVRVRTWVNDLANATIAYSRDNNDVYPGQDLKPGVLDGTTADAYSGSQYLSRALFGIVTVNGNNLNINYPTATKYMQLGSEDLIDPATNSNSQTVDKFAWKTISDRRNNPMPVLYYPSRPGYAALNQYAFNDNLKHTPGPDYNSNQFYQFIVDQKYQFTVNSGTIDTATGTPRNPRGFLLIAAGSDGKYFTGDDIRYPAWTK